MNRLIALAAVILAIGCEEASQKPESIEMIARTSQQDSLYRSLLQVAGYGLQDSLFKDSSAFLVLPVQASCPSCRKKTIDSIVKHQKDLLAHHYIIICANGGRKTITAFFREQNAELPDLPNQIILDSLNSAYKLNLFKDNPAIYYAENRKVYKRVFAIPATVKQDLHEFFSGNRMED